METFRDIPNYEGMYQAGTLGNIKSFPQKTGRGSGYLTKGKILKQCTDKGGYKIITLCKNKEHKTKTVHRLIAATYLGESTLDVNHKDGNKGNNNPSNLEYVTKSENTIHAIRNGLLTPNHKKIAEDKRKKVFQINRETNVIEKEYISAHEAARKTGMNRGNISTACRNGVNLVGGYRWSYGK